MLMCEARRHNCSVQSSAYCTQVGCRCKANMVRVSEMAVCFVNHAVFAVVH
jgi:hypothetical protein